MLLDSLFKVTKSLLLVLLAGLLAYLLIIHWGPDPVYEQLGRHATEQDIRELQQQLGYEKPFLDRYLSIIKGFFVLNPGRSAMNGESIRTLLIQTVPVSMALVLPGLLLGSLMSIGLALVAAGYVGRAADKLITFVSTAVMSASFVLVIIGLQLLLASPAGLDLFPVAGWNVDSVAGYFRSIFVPTLILVLIHLGYSLRFNRTVVVGEADKEYAHYARAFGIPEREILMRLVLPNCLMPILTRVVYSLPGMFLASSLLIESHFSIPGFGKLVYDAILFGDQLLLVTVVMLSSAFFAVAKLMLDLLQERIDPSVRQSAYAGQLS